MSGLTAWQKWELASFDPEVPANGDIANGPEAEMSPADQMERLRQRAREDGYEAGYTAGEVAGRESGQAAVQAEAARLRQAADSLDTSFAELNQHVADELLALAIEIARQVVRKELTVQADAIVDIVREALEQIPYQHASIYLNPGDASLIRTHMGDGLSHAGHRLYEDPKLNPGDCLLESGGSLVDGSVATRWKRVLENLGLSSAWDDVSP